MRFFWTQTIGGTRVSIWAAVGYLLVGVFAGLALDLCAKRLLADYSLEQFVLIRTIFGVLFFLFAAPWAGGLAALKTKRPGWHVLRTLLASGAMFGFFYGLARMPLVDVLTLVFIAPLIVTALSVPILGEQVGWRRWAAVIAGFAGVLIVLRPGDGLITPAAMAVIVAAFCWAGLALTARKLGDTESSYSLAMYVIGGPLVFSAFLVPGNYVPPLAIDWVFLVLAGLCSTVAWFGISEGYRRAPPVVLAPFEYTTLVGGAIAGYVFWNEVPDLAVLVGATIIVASGIYIVFREVGGSVFAKPPQNPG